MILSKSLDEMIKLFEEILDKEMPVINGFSGTNAWKNIEADAKIELVTIESESKQIFSYMKNKK